MPLHKDSIKPKELSNQKSFLFTKTLHTMFCKIFLFCGFFSNILWTVSFNPEKLSGNPFIVCFIDCALVSDLRNHWNRQGHEDMCFLMDLETISSIRLSKSGLRHHLDLIFIPCRMVHKQMTGSPAKAESNLTGSFWNSAVKWPGTMQVFVE